MNEITRVGADLAKRVIQVHGVDAAGKLVTNRPLPRDKFIAWCTQAHPPGLGCTHHPGSLGLSLSATR